MTIHNFVIRRSGDLAVPCSVAWALQGTGASPITGASFAGGVLPSGSVSFAPQETSRPASFDFTATAKPLFQQTGQLVLNGPVGCKIDPAGEAHQLTIPGQTVSGDTWDFLPQNMTVHPAPDQASRVTFSAPGGVPQVAVAGAANLDSNNIAIWFNALPFQNYEAIFEYQKNEDLPAVDGGGRFMQFWGAMVGMGGRDPDVTKWTPAQWENVDDGDYGDFSQSWRISFDTENINVDNQNEARLVLWNMGVQTRPVSISPNFWMEGLNKYRVVVRKDNDTVTISANTPTNESVQWIDPNCSYPGRIGFRFGRGRGGILRRVANTPFIRELSGGGPDPDPDPTGDFPGDWMLATAPISSGPNYVPITNLAQLQANVNATAGKQLVVQGMVDLGGASIQLHFQGTSALPVYLRTAQFAPNSHTALVSGFRNGRLVLNGCNRVILCDLKLDGCKILFEGASNTQLERYWQLNCLGDTYNPAIEFFGISPNINCLVGFGRYDGGAGNAAPFYEETAGFYTTGANAGMRRPSPMKGLLITNIHINGMRGDVKHFASGRNPGDGCNDIGQILQNVLATGSDGLGSDWSENKFTWHFRNIWIEATAGATAGYQIKHRQGRVRQENNLGAGNGGGSIYEHIYYIVYPGAPNPYGVSIRDGYHIVRYCAAFAMNSNAQPTVDTPLAGGRGVTLWKGKIAWDGFDHNVQQPPTQVFRLINAGACQIHSNMMGVTCGDAVNSQETDPVAPEECWINGATGTHRNRSLNIIAHQGAPKNAPVPGMPGYGTINKRLQPADVGPGAWKAWFKI